MNPSLPVTDAVLPPAASGAAVFDPALAVFSLLDIAVVALPMLFVVLVALYMRRFNRSVADYLAASRSAGRYLISTAQMEIHMTAIAMVGTLEVFSRTGFSLNLWNTITGFTFFLLSLSGLITYRFRETRALTFHQFLEMRYSKGVRVYATALNVFSGLFTFGIAPGIAARFFVYFLGLPPEIAMLGLQVPTFGLVMVVLVSLALFFAMAGGHISVMMVDCIEGLISSALYLVVGFTILCLFSHTQMEEAFTSGPPGRSYVDPFDVSGQSDFGYLYVILLWLTVIYYWRGNAWNAAFTASARSAHEGQMAVILGVWRNIAAAGMGMIVGLGAFVLMHHPDFTAQATAVQHHLIATIPEIDKQLRTQLVIPTALGVLLPMGVKGALAAIMLMGTVAGLSSSLFNFSAGLIQDVVLPLRGGKRLEPRTHIFVLRLAAVGLGIFAIVFSLTFRITDYVQMIMQLLGGIYLAGIGAVVWGGLYWSRATASAAWASLITGSSLAFTGAVLQQIWPWFALTCAGFLGDGPWHDWFLSHPHKLPINGQILTASIMGLCLLLFVSISFATSRQPHDMDRLLHRGRWAVEGSAPPQTRRGFTLAALAGVSQQFTKGDKRIAYTVLIFGVLNPVGALVAILWNGGLGRWSPGTWFAWHLVWSVWIPLTIGLITFVWFTWGALRDMRQLLIDLKQVKTDANDDGQVHHP